MQNGRYYKIGKQVTVVIDVALSALNSFGNISISGLPFAPLADSTYRFSASVGEFYGTALDNISALLIGASSAIGLYIPTANAQVFSAVLEKNINNSFRIILELTYLTA